MTQRGKTLDQLEELILKQGLKPEYQKIQYRLLVRHLKQGKSMTGYMHLLKRYEGEGIYKKFGIWARKRGLNFEKLFIEKLNNFRSDFYPYSNLAGFRSQPFDVIIFFKDAAPIFIECKSSGVKISKNKNRLLIDKNGRAFKGCFEKKQSLLEFIRETGSKNKFFFVAPLESDYVFINGFALLSNLEITKNFYFIWDGSKSPIWNFLEFKG